MLDDIQLLQMLPAAYLVVTLLVAAIVDLVSHRIPNKLLAPALAVAVLGNVLLTGTDGLLACLAGLAIGLAMLMPLYIMGAMGAGDVKLLGVAGAFVGPFGALIAGLATYIVGAIYGMLWILWHRLRPAAASHHVNLWFPELAALMPGFAGWLGSLSSSKTVGGRVAAKRSESESSAFAYAPAIAIGVIFTLWFRGWPNPTVLG